MILKVDAGIATLSHLELIQGGMNNGESYRGAVTDVNSYAKVLEAADASIFTNASRGVARRLRGARTACVTGRTALLEVCDRLNMSHAGTSRVQEFIARMVFAMRFPKCS